MRRMIAAATLLVSAGAHAAIIALPFREIVRRADVIFVGEVADTSSRIVLDRGTGKIVTDVTFRVTRVLKGAAGATRVLVFAGGVVGDRALAVEDVPRFTPGERDVIFAMASPSSLSPIVGMSQGRFRIVADANGREMVQQFDGTPVRDVASIGSPDPPPVFSPSPFLSPAAFEAAVLAELRRQR
jgi:hypothetical protein